jgi:6-phosphogluconolactonase
MGKIMNLNIFNSQNEEIAAIFNELTLVINKLLKTHSVITIAVSGGKSPIHLFDKLSNTDLPWDKINITLVDERIVDTLSEDSNEHLVKKHLLKNKAKNAKFIGLVDNLLDIEGMLLRNQINTPSIDIAILGMGEDGHTASIFPDCKELEQAVDLKNESSYINTNPITAKYSRISLTLNSLIKIPYIFFSINGELKLKVFKEAARGNNQNYPISYLLKSRSDAKTFWYI